MCVLSFSWILSCISRRVSFFICDQALSHLPMASCNSFSTRVKEFYFSYGKSPLGRGSTREFRIVVMLSFSMTAPLAFGAR